MPRPSRSPGSTSTTRSCTTSPPSAACSPRPTSSTWSRPASRRTRSSARSPTRSCMQNLSVLTRGNTLQAQGAPARRAEHLPAVPAGVLAPAHPADLGRARLRLPQGRADRGADLRPRERPVLRGATARCCTACTRSIDVGALRRGIDGLDEYITHGRKARLGETAGPPLVAGPRASSTSSASCTRSPSSSPRSSSRGRSCAASSASTAARPRRRPCSSTKTASILAKAYQLSKGNPIQDTKELLARAAQDRASSAGRDARGHRLRRHRLRRRRARGVVQARRQHRRDRRAHDERRALLRRRRRHLRHRRAGHQGPVHEERRHQELPPVELSARPATACCCRRWPISSALPVTEYADTAFEAELAPKFSYGCAVFLDTDRVNFQKEGYSKEELLAGPRAGAAEERLAVRRADPAPRRARAASSCCRAARSTTSPRSRRRSTTSRSACPAPRCSCTRTPARPARSARRWRRCAWSSAGASSTSSASMPAIDLDYTTKNDE